MKEIFKNCWLYAAAAAMAFCAAGADAQTLKVGTGADGFAYASQFTETQQVCGKELPMVSQKTSGAVENVDLLLSNEINAGYTQADILYLKAKAQPDEMSGIKTLYVTGNENLHFIMKSAPIKIGGYGAGGFTVGGKEVTFTELGQIGGLTVAAGGGAIGSAKQVRLESEVNYKILEVKDGTAAIAALESGKADVALVVSGPGSKALAAMSDEYRVLAIPASLQDKLKGVYNPARVTYKGIAPNGVSTVSVQGLFVTREYKTPKMQQALAALKSCVLSNLDEIKEKTGTHPSWQLMKLEDQDKAKWPLYKLPVAAKK